MSILSCIKKFFARDDEIVKADNDRPYKNIESRIVKSFIGYADFCGVEWDELYITVNKSFFYYLCEFTYLIRGKDCYLYRKNLCSLDLLERENYFKISRGKKGCIAFYAVDYITKVLGSPGHGFNTITIDKERNLILNKPRLGGYKKFDDKIFTDKDGSIGYPFLNDELEDISHVSLSYSFEYSDDEDPLPKMLSEWEVDFSLNLNEIEDLERRFSVKITLDITGECIFDEEAKALALEDSRFCIESF